MRNADEVERRKKASIRSIGCQRQSAVLFSVARSFHFRARTTFDIAIREHTLENFLLKCHKCLLICLFCVHFFFCLPPSSESNIKSRSFALSGCGGGGGNRMREAQFAECLTKCKNNNNDNRQQQPSMNTNTKNSKSHEIGKEFRIANVRKKNLKCRRQNSR